MRPSFFALAALGFLLSACGGYSSQPSIATPPATATVQTGSPITPSGKIRIALLLPLSGRDAAIGQSLQQAGEMALFDNGAKDIALAAYDSGNSPDRAVEAYRKARMDGVALVLGPLFGSSAGALGPVAQQDGVNVISFSNDESVARPGVWIMGIAAPPQVRRVVDYALSTGIRRFAAFAPQTAYGQQMAQTMQSYVTQRGGTVVGTQLYADGTDLSATARSFADGLKGGDKVAVLVPVAPGRLSAVMSGLAAGGIDNRSAQFIGTGVWDVPNIGSDPTVRGAWYAAPDPAKRGDFERRYTAIYGRPPHRLATIAYDAVALAANLARLKQGGDFSAAAITNPDGWAGVDGVFRFFPDGRSERALAVLEVQSDRSVVVSPAPRSFVGVTTN